MKILYTHKYNRRILRKSLHPCYRDMLQLCANDLAADGFHGSVRLILQTGKSREQSRSYGVCDYFNGIIPKIYIYTRYRRVMTNVDTIAHEFGHISHFFTVPESRYWSSEKKEQYACKYAALMMERFHAQRRAAASV